MSDRDDPITDFDLTAYADGKLDPARAETVRAYLERNPEAGARVRDYVAQNEALHEVYDPVVREPLPQRLAEAVAPRWRAGLAHRPARAAAVILLATATGVGGWMLGRSWQADAFGVQAFAVDAAAAHDQQRLPESADLKADFAPLKWLTKRVSLELKAPDLSQRGYQLVARQKVRLNGRPAVQLAYRSGDGERLSVFLRERWRRHRPRIRTTTAGQSAMAYWLDGPIAYGVMSRRPASELRGLAQLIDEKITIEPKVVPGRIEAHDKGGTNAGG